MDLNSVIREFPTHESCIAHLEGVLWGNKPFCPYCDSTKVSRKRDGSRVGRWNCKNCQSSFNVLAGTILQGTRVPLQKWFCATAMLQLDNQDSISSHRLARSLALNQKTALLLKKKIQSAKGKDVALLRSIIDSVESKIGT